MQENIIFIKGVADSSEEPVRRAESKRLNLQTAALRSAGHAVQIVGNTAEGFNMDNVAAAFRACPQTKIVFVDCHGSVVEDQHYLYARTDEPLGIEWADDLYRKLGAYSNGKPLNIFMSSCGSGNGHLDAATILPPGSTLVSFTSDRNTDSYPVEVEAFAVNGTSGSNFAEQFFLSILCKGLGQERHLPHLSVSVTDDPEHSVWNLWEKVCSLCSNNLVYGTNNLVSGAKFKTEVSSRLSMHLSANDLFTTLSTIRLFVKAFTHKAFTDPKTPVTLKVNVDHKDLYHSATRNKLLGPMCAAAYIAMRREIGAFQIWEPTQYLRPRSLIRGPELL